MEKKIVRVLRIKFYVIQFARYIFLRFQNSNKKRRYHHYWTQTKMAWFWLAEKMILQYLKNGMEIHRALEFLVFPL